MNIVADISGVEVVGIIEIEIVEISMDFIEGTSLNAEVMRMIKSHRLGGSSVRFCG